MANQLAKSLIAIGFRHASEQHTEEERIQLKLYQSLCNWKVDPDVGCADLHLGLCYDLRDVFTSVKQQNPNYKLVLSRTFQRCVSATVFSSCDEVMEIRRMTIIEFGKVNWRIPLVVKAVDICTGLGRLHVKVLLGEQESTLFNIFPLIRAKVPDNTDMVFDLGECHEKYDYYFTGNIWLAPTAIVLSNQ